MMGIVQKVLADPNSYSVDSLKRMIELGMLPPYVGVPLIAQQMERRKRLQMQGAMSQPNPDQQPTVADQIMGQARGIDTLQTNLPEEYSGGGIVAFAGGGLSQEERDRAAIIDTLRRAGAATADVLSLPFRGLAGAAESAITRPLRAMGAPIPYLPRWFYGGDASSLTPFMDRLRRERGEDAVTAPPSIAQQRPSAPPVSTPSPAPARQSAAPGMGDAVSQARGIMAALGPTPQFQAPRGPSARDETEQVLRQAEMERQGNAMQYARQREAIEGRVTGQAYEDYERRLREREAQMPQRREQAFNEALVMAGLGIAGGRSPYALQNISQGALPAMANYQQSRKELEAESRDLDKISAMIGQARRAESIGDRDRALAALDTARQEQNAWIKDRASALSQAMGVDRQTAIRMAEKQFEAEMADRNLLGRGAFGIAMADRENAARLQAAAIGAVGRGTRGAIDEKTMLKLAGDIERDYGQEMERAVLKQLGLKSKPTAGPALEEFARRYQGMVQDRIRSRLATLGYGDEGGSSAARSFEGMSVVGVRPDR